MDGYKCVCDGCNQIYIDNGHGNNADQGDLHDIIQDTLSCLYQYMCRTLRLKQSGLWSGLGK